MAFATLPTELFNQVMAELVKGSPVEVTWKLRAVNRHFDAAIAHQVLEALPPQAFASRVASRILGANLAYYLAVRVQGPKADDARPELLKKVAMMAEYLYTKLETKDGDKWKILMRLCEGLASMIRPTLSAGDIRDLLWLNDHDYQTSSWDKDFIERDFDIGDQAVACMAIGDLALVDETLPDVPADTYFGIYGKLLRFAVVCGDLALLNTIMDLLTNDRSKSMMKKRALVLGDSTFSVTQALYSAISRDEIIMFRRLLEFLVAHVRYPSTIFYTELLEAAISSRDDSEYLRAIFRAVGKSWSKRKYRVPLSMFRDLCAREAAGHIVALIEGGGLDVNSTESESNPLVLAIRSGSETSVGAVLTAGADIDLPVHHQQRKRTMTALEYVTAPCGKYATRYWAIDYLLSQGAALPALSAWPLQRTIYNTFRDAKYSREGIIVPEWKVFRDMKEAERAAL